MPKISLPEGAEPDQIEDEVNNALNRFKSKDGEPLLADIPDKFDWMFFDDRTTGKSYIIRNCNGTLKKTELT